MSYGEKSEGVSGKQEKRGYYELLNGRWKFYYRDWYVKVGGEISCGEVSREGWEDIKVGGKWEVEGLGRGIYRNEGYEFEGGKGEGGLLGEKNGVGVQGGDIRVG